MSLDVYLEIDDVVVREGSGIFIRRHEEIEEISRAEWDEMCPWHEPTILDSVPTKREMYRANITHNLNRMAEEAGIYKHLWRPEEIGITRATELIEPLERGLALLRSDPKRFKAFNATNGWGTYPQFMQLVENYVIACMTHPEARVRVSR